MKKVFTFTLLLFCISAISQSYLTKGDIIKDFTFQTLNGETISIEDLRGKVVYINFFATWCQPCIKELSLLQDDMLNEINNDDFYFVALGRGHSIEELTRFKDNKDFKFRIGLDTDKSRFKRFSEKGIPHNVIIDKEGKILLSENGFSTAGYKRIKRKIKFQLWF